MSAFRETLNDVLVRTLSSWSCTVTPFLKSCVELKGIKTVEPVLEFTSAKTISITSLRANAAACEALAAWPCWAIAVAAVKPVSNIAMMRFISLLVCVCDTKMHPQMAFTK